MKVYATFVVTASVEIPLDLDKDEFHDWLNTDDVEPTPGLAREFFEAGEGFPTDGIIDAINEQLPHSVLDYYVDLERVRMPSNG